MENEGEKAQERYKGRKQVVRVEEQLESSCKKGVGDLTATCRRVPWIDSKIYDVRREKGSSLM